MDELMRDFVTGLALGFGFFGWFFSLRNSKKINKLEKKLQDEVIDICAAVVHDDNLLESDIKELKDKVTFLVSTNDMRLINNHINRVERRIDRLAEIINGKRKVK